MSSGFDIYGESIDDISGGCYLAYYPESYVAYDIDAIKALRRKYNLPKDRPIDEQLAEIGAPDTEKQSIYLHS